LPVHGSVADSANYRPEQAKQCQERKKAEKGVPEAKMVQLAIYVTHAWSRSRFRPYSLVADLTECRLSLS